MRRPTESEPPRPAEVPPEDLADRYLTPAGTPPPEPAGILPPGERPRPPFPVRGEADLEC